MNSEKIIEVMNREIRAIGHYYRNDWSDFDGRSLRQQLESLASWCEKAIKGETQQEFTTFSEWLTEQQENL